MVSRAPPAAPPAPEGDRGGGGEPGVPDVRPAGRLLIESDRCLAAITETIRAEMAGLHSFHGEILRMMRAELGARGHAPAAAPAWAGAPGAGGAGGAGPAPPAAPAHWPSEASGGLALDFNASASDGRPATASQPVDRRRRVAIAPAMNAPGRVSAISDAPEPMHNSPSWPLMAHASSAAGTASSRLANALWENLRLGAFAAALAGEADGSHNRSAVRSKPSTDTRQYGSGREPEATSGWAPAWPPESASRTLYEAFSVALVMFDAITLPYALAWSVPEEGFWYAAAWCTRLFWSADLLVSFATGYVTSDFHVERRLHLTAKHFFKRWFLCDAALVTSDWSSSVFPGMRLICLARLVRLIRHTRRMYVLLQRAKARLYHEVTRLAIDIMLLVLILFWMAHMFGCWWFFMGRWEEAADTGETWLSDGTYSGVGSSYEYLTALHWSVTQFTPASMEVAPRCSAERLYNVIVIFVSFFVGSTVVATLTAMMTQYRLQVGEAMRKMRQLQAFLDQEKVDRRVAWAVRVRVATVLREGQRLRATQVELMGLVNSSLRDALSLQVRRRQLVPHPFLGAWARIDSSCFKSFMDNVMTEREMKRGDVVFLDADEGSAMYFVSDGALSYKPGPFAREKLFDESDKRLQCHLGEFCAEIALWYEWSHVGTMTAVATTELAVVDASSCTLELLYRHPAAEKVLRSYVIEFARSMWEQDSLPSDLCYDIDYHELMFGLSLESRVALSEPLFRQVGSGGNSLIEAPALSKAQVGKLTQAVAKGQDIVGIAGAEMVRFTVVAAIRVYLSDQPEMLTAAIDMSLEIPQGHKFLAKLGEIEASGVSRGGCVLPGGKRRSQETTRDTIKRIVETDLQPLIPSIDFRTKEGRSRELFFKESPTYGVRTCYSRTCFVGFTDDNLERCSTPSPGPDFQPKLPRESPRWMQRLLGRMRITAEDVETQRRATELLQDIEAVARGRDDGSVTLYAWVTQSEFELLSDEHVKLVLDQWTEAVRQRAGQLGTFCVAA